MTLAELTGCALLILGGVALTLNEGIGWTLGAVGVVLLYEARA
jgi:hypothetical protein